MPDSTNNPRTIPEYYAWLDRAWAWLGKHSGRRDWEDKFQLWLTRLREYEALCRQEHIEMQRGRQQEMAL